MVTVACMSLIAYIYAKTYTYVCTRMSTAVKAYLLFGDMQASFTAKNIHICKYISAETRNVYFTGTYTSTLTSQFHQLLLSQQHACIFGFQHFDCQHALPPFLRFLALPSNYLVVWQLFHWVVWLFACSSSCLFLVYLVISVAFRQTVSRFCRFIIVVGGSGIR